MRRIAPLAAALVLAGCGGNETQTVPPGAVAVVDGHAITRAALAAELARTRRAYATRGRDFPDRGTPAYEQLERAAAALLVGREHLALEAERLGITVRPAQVDAGVRRLQQTRFGGSERAFREQLRQTGLTVADVRRAIRDQLLATAVGRRGRPAEVTYAPGFEPSGAR
jgi:SurA-like N-terminal domain